MINEDKIREVWASNPERGFKLLIDFFQQPIYWHIRRVSVSAILYSILKIKSLMIPF